MENVVINEQDFKDSIENRERTRRLDRIRQQIYQNRYSMHVAGGGGAGQNEAQNTAQDRFGERTKRYLNACMFCSFVMFATMFLIGLLVSVHFFVDTYYQTHEQRYANLRERLMQRERLRRLGGSLDLSEKEHYADEKLAAIKAVDEELNEQHMLRDYKPIPRFLNKYNISETDLYWLLKSMPKGGLLHVHDAGMFKADMLIEMSHEPNLWVCVNILGEFEEFYFSNYWPEHQQCSDCECNWQLMTDFWSNKESHIVEAQLRKSLTLNSDEYMSRQELSRRLKRIKHLVQGLITYKPFWSEFLFRMMKDFYDDGVQYVELRSSLPILYDLVGTNYTIWDTANAIQVVTNIFKTTACDFIGTKLIYAPLREGNSTQIDKYIKNAHFLKENFPELYIGFDLISLGDECERPMLKDYTLNLLHINKKIDFYFHAGESFCYNNTSGDENLIDAILLNSKRIGGSIQLPRHPEILRLMRLLNTAIEVCPLSDHYLQIYNDFQAHPAAYLMAAGYPIVIGSDYPYFWNAAPLTDDFYVAFVGISTSNGNLGLLKQLALNSLLYSGLRGQERSQAIRTWRNNWSKWVNEFIQTKFK